jgi:hypothetical protein
MIAFGEGLAALCPSTPPPNGEDFEFANNGNIEYLSGVTGLL